MVLRPKVSTNSGISGPTASPVRAYRAIKNGDGPCSASLASAADIRSAVKPSSGMSSIATISFSSNSSVQDNQRTEKEIHSFDTEPLTTSVLPCSFPCFHGRLRVQIRRDKEVRDARNVFFKSKTLLLWSEINKTFSSKNAPTI